MRKEMISARLLGEVLVDTLIEKRRHTSLKRGVTETPRFPRPGPACPAAPFAFGLSSINCSKQMFREATTRKKGRPPKDEARKRLTM
jgi:hypothetical protein